MSDPRDSEGRRLSPDQRTLGERLDERDWSGEWTVAMEAESEANDAEQEAPWIAAEIAGERRFAQWLAFPGDRA
ncbi:MAG: hypothetical protein H7255_11540 [Ramlibacter sp.]|nr:hypothetical protein [Ramlibacter sp.]